MALKNLIGEVLDGKYHIEKQLGEGGMGAVYFATHLGTERPVALKVIAPQFMKHDEFVERFRREARAAGRLRHPNVVDVTDFGFARVGADQVAYLVMEYLDGCTLDEILEEETSLPLSWVIDILEQTCSAVDEAHQQGIIHRDLKPDNIWLEPNRRGGYTIKVLDFGIAKLDEIAEPTSTNSAEEYLPPRTPIFDSLAPTESGESPTLITGGESAPPAAELSEAATQIQPPAAQTGADLSEAGTLAFTPEADESEAGTRMLPAQSMEEMGTRILEQRTTDKQIVMQTGSASSLTRVGSILGTPLYMSPEQCRGERLDARTDIYSLGVIAYRLLSGQTPFSGDLHAVMKMHCDEPPPPLKVKHVPKKVQALVMSALSKNPDERPPNAAAFSSALRAHSEGAGSLLRRALTLYSEHLPVFLRLALLVFAPVIVFTLLQVTVTTLNMLHLIPQPWDGVLRVSVTILTFLVNFVSASIIAGVTTWLVTQMLAVPLRPVLLRPAFSAIKKRLRPFLTTTILISLLVLAGVALCFIPGVYLACNFALVASVLMMEDFRGRAAMKRSRALYKRSRRTVFAIILTQFFVPLVLSSGSSLLILAVIAAFRKGELKGTADITSILQQLVALPLTIMATSLTSVITALLYWKTRLAGGETLRQAFVQFADEEVSARKWQQRMRTRLQTHMKTHR
ncbi:MAG: serine/threonine protein kinase [Pyrinomonadaceae bacterium]|nr:serine/threonine protein kinase [Pyrinomonadaceae bacterium]